MFHATTFDTSFGHIVLKKSLLTILIAYLLHTMSVASVLAIKSITITAGGLSTALTPSDMDTLTNLKIFGSMDSRDFALFRSGRLYKLKEINLNDVSIEAFGHYPKNQLPSSAFLRCINLTTIILPSSITSIGDSAFYKCSALSSITIPDSVTTIGKYAFSLCTSVSYLKLPQSLRIIDDLTFYCCLKLKSITIPHFVTRIGCNAFSISGLTSLAIPNSVSFIGDGAFEDCNALKEIYIPESVNYIGRGAFVRSGISEIQIPTSIDSIFANTFAYCTHLYSVAIPNSVTYIGSNAFSYCSNLLSVVIPDSVNFIGDYAFYNCTGLTSLNACRQIPIDLSFAPHIFDFIDKSICTLYVPIGSLRAYENAVNWNDFVRISELKGDETHEEGDSTDIIKSISISAGELFTALTTNEFNNITELTIRGDINYKDFAVLRYMMPKLTKLDLKGTSVKEYNSKYQQNEIPYDAFRNCSSLTLIVLPETLVSIDQYAFCNCTDLKTIVFFDSLFHIGVYAFLGCTSLTSVECPPLIGMIEAGAFMDCSSLSNITLPNSIEYIGRAAFKNCINLESVILPASLDCINERTFSSCSKLSKVLFPSNLSEIGDWAFESCKSLSTITIPESLNLIGDGAFGSCKSLNTIYSFSEWPADCSSAFSFGDSNKACQLFVSIGSKDKYQNATGWSYFNDIIEMVKDSHESVKYQEIRMWFNHATESLQFDELEDSARISLFDLNGRILKTSLGGNGTMFSMEGVPNGFYIVQVRTKEKIVQQKIVKGPI